MHDEQRTERKRTTGRKWVRAIGTALGALLGVGIAIGIVHLLRMALLWPNPSGTTLTLIYAASAAVGAFLFFLASIPIFAALREGLKRAERYLTELPARELGLGAIGLLFGLVLAFLLTPLLNPITLGFVYIPLAILLYAGLGGLGLRVMLLRRDITFAFFSRKGSKAAPTANPTGGKPKILDTSVIIDGRIFDIMKTGFIDGPLVVPEFVLGELQHIADSGDSLKRNRGRRGLEVLERVRAESPGVLHVDGTDFPDVPEVDVKLLRLAEQLEGYVVTNDYNLNKVAGLTGMFVLNLNELANAVKPVVLPGEEMSVAILKEGKEPGQGIAYLDDGTMIVVENGKRSVGSTVDVVVTSVLQTAAGRMIFTKLKVGEKAV